ncbi:hypothetical protein U6Q56_12210, partial [Cutibacterium acnes]
MSYESPPSPADFEAAIDKIAKGLGTAAEAELISRYVLEIEEVCEYYRSRLAETREMLLQERAANERFQRELNKAFNSGSGAYIP